MSNPVPPVPPVNPDDASYEGPDIETEVDGEPILDPDVNDDLVDSADADRRAAEDPRLTE